MTLAYDVAVVGAGIVGSACAQRLASRGLSVVVLDAVAPSNGTTAAGMGHVVVMDGHATELAMTALSQRLWADLAEAMPDSVEYQRCGTLWVAADDEEMAEAEAKAQTYREHGIETQMLNAAALAKAEPALRSDLAGALRVPGDSVLYQPNATRWLLDRAIDRGTVVRAPVQVKVVADGQVELTDGTSFEAEHVVVAGGIATASVLDTRALDNAITPRKGHLAVTARGHQMCDHQLVELGYIKRAHSHARESVAFNLQPRRTGQVVIGSSRQYGCADHRVEPDMLGRMFRRALAFMPALARVPIVRTWTGFRPATADGLPLIGALPDDPRTIIAAGHEGLGITTSVGTAAVVESIVRQTAPPLDIDRFSPWRAMEAC